MSTGRQDIPFIFLIGGIIAYGFALAVYTVANSDVFGLVTLNGDDAFYYFQVARNTAEGHFSSFDGGITRTNGYHPLWMFVLVPFFLAFDAESALFAIKFFETLVLASGIALVALAARLARLPWPPPSGRSGRPGGPVSGVRGRRVCAPLRYAQRRTDATPGELFV